MSPVQYSAELQSKFRGQLANRRARLERTIADLNQPADLLLLLNDVDAALSRLDGGSYGECAVCHTEIAADDLLANPTASYCLCELTPERQRALERDLTLAWRVQAALLPAPDLAVSGWQAHYRYIPNGPVSGDYCDLIVTDANPAAEFYFMLGDVSGKGVAASADGPPERVPARFRPDGFGAAGSFGGSQSPPGREHADLSLRHAGVRAR